MLGSQVQWGGGLKNPCHLLSVLFEGVGLKINGISLFWGGFAFESDPPTPASLGTALAPFPTLLAARNRAATAFYHEKAPHLLDFASLSPSEACPLLCFT